MASITIRNLDDVVKARLRIRAAEHGRSMEEEARCILREVLESERPLTLGQIAREIFGGGRGVDLEPHPPVTPRDPPKFE